ncbi:hypothetical protein PCC7418_0107 [Halothece sp. PCC 7418]|uniref:hypothetical protein n=1 Tax=Halothece sp. (strain PCC 7418) TaxID=65093 RepID=UPI0002A0600B|nr:hypothetical protein [Halothece sp. PCC 7418]AFZ42353.1 hypothetical protein PCC7418_0107 [Halothece sp. PCC 7418]
MSETQSAIHITTKVLPGNRIEVELPSDLEGKAVDVFVVLPKDSQTKKNNNILEIIEEARKHRIGMTPEEIDAYLKEERESWD